MSTLPDRAGPSTARRRHPIVARLDRERADDVQLRLADRITRFAGSMPFVYLHIVLFALWMVLFEDSPWPTLTLLVSLEAIILSTFVLIGQNRQAAFQQAKADHDFAEAERGLRTNTEVTLAIHELAREIRERQVADAVERNEEGSARDVSTVQDQSGDPRAPSETHARHVRRRVGGSRRS